MAASHSIDIVNSCCGLLRRLIDLLTWYLRDLRIPNVLLIFLTQPYMLIHFIVFISKDAFPSQVPHMKQKRSRSLITKVNQIFYQKGNFIQKQLY